MKNLIRNILRESEWDWMNDIQPIPNHGEWTEENFFYILDTHNILLDDEDGRPYRYSYDGKCGRYVGNDSTDGGEKVIIVHEVGGDTTNCNNVMTFLDEALDEMNSYNTKNVRLEPRNGGNVNESEESDLDWMRGVSESDSLKDSKHIIVFNRVINEEEWDSIFRMYGMTPWPLNQYYSYMVNLKNPMVIYNDPKDGDPLSWSTYKSISQYKDGHFEINVDVVLDIINDEKSN
jgi:hypothetical protein